MSRKQWVILIVLGLANLVVLCLFALLILPPLKFYGCRGSRGCVRRLVGAMELSEETPLAFSPDGKLLAVGMEKEFDGIVKVWSVPYGMIPRTLKIEELTITHLAFSPEGTRLAINLDDGTLQVRRVSDFALLHTLDGGYRISDMVFSPDGVWLAVAKRDEVVVWRVADGALWHTIQAERGTCDYLAFFPEGMLAISGSNYRQHKTEIWQIEDRELAHTLPDNWAWRMVFLPGKHRLVMVSSSELHMCRTSDWVCDRTWHVSDWWAEQGMTAPHHSLLDVVAAQGSLKMATELTHDNVGVCRLSDGLCTGAFNIGHHVGDPAVAFSSDGTLMALGTDMGIWLWDVSPSPSIPWLPPTEVEAVNPDYLRDLIDENLSVFLLGCLILLVLAILIPLSLYGLSINSYHIWRCAPDGPLWLSGYYIGDQQPTKCTCVRCGETGSAPTSGRCVQSPLIFRFVQAVVYAGLYGIIEPIRYGIGGLVAGFFLGAPALAVWGVFIGLVSGFFGGWFAGLTDQSYPPNFGRHDYDQIPLTGKDIAPWASDL